ncbi:MAG: hypothetical protein AAB547_00560 [Patescibacteria group bacterium]
MLEKIQGIVKDHNIGLDQLAIHIAKEIRNEKQISTDEKRKLFGLVRSWKEYASDNAIDHNDLLQVRYHLLRFSKKYFTPLHELADEKKPEILCADIRNLSLPDNTPLVDHLESSIGRGVCEDTHIAIYGGIARLALKLHVANQNDNFNGALIESELPINDVDIVADDIDAAHKYRSGISGTRVIDDIEEYKDTYFSTVDYTMNQALIHGRELLFSAQAYSDVKQGVLHISEKNETLFNPDSVRLKDGKIFITSKGFYRALCYLLRDKARVMDIHTDNLIALNKNNYQWAGPLLKLLNIKEKERRDTAISRWLALAQSLSATQASHPAEFLQEIIEHNPHIVNFDFATEKDDEAEIRWIINQFLNSGLRTVFSHKQNYPDSMSDDTQRIDIATLHYQKHDLREFFTLINNTFKNAPTM